MTFSDYTQKTVQEVFKELQSSSVGLNQQEVVLRQQKYGYNEFPQNHNTIITIFLRQLTSPFFYLIAFAAVISFFIGEKIDGMVIVATALINVFLGFFQEYRAEKAISLLRKFIPQQVKVLRLASVKENVSEEQLIEKKYLVPGDIVLLEAGDIVPADMRIFEQESFIVDESLLTGESVPVTKSIEKKNEVVKEIFKANNILFTGSSVVSGKAKGIVIGTRNNTVLGGITRLVSITNRQSTYEKGILYFCKLILRVVLVTIFLIFTLNLLVKGPGDIFSLILFSVALIISILPEALPAVITFALAKGSMKMANQHVVVRRLSAIEDLGNIEILCSDKTGTITENKLSLEKVISFDQVKCLLYGILSSSGYKKDEKILNPFDASLISYAKKDVLLAAKEYQIISELPFDSSRMCSSILVRDHSGEKMLIVKGAPEIIFKKTSKEGSFHIHQEVRQAVEQEGINGKRVLAIGFRKIDNNTFSKGYDQSQEKDLTFLGYFVFEDPLKPTTIEAIRLSKKLGVQIKIITGDSKEVSEYVAKKINLMTADQVAILGEELEAMSEVDFDQACLDHVVFARISPEIKYNIIKSLQKKYDVGFLGEGINDAPALKIANVAITVPSASDISREVSDVVMLKKDLCVLVDGIKEGRHIFANINKYIKFTLASNFGNFYSIAIISLFTSYLPMLPVQILLGNLLSDFPLISIATDSVDPEELKKPKLYQLHHLLPFITIMALVSTVFDIIFFLIFKGHHPSQIQTLWFVASMLTEFGLVYIMRTNHLFWKAKRPSFALLFFTIVAFLICIALPFLGIGQELFHFVQPSIISIFIVVGLVILYLIASEIVKLEYFHRTLHKK